MWTKVHKIFFAALLASKIPSVNKKLLKQYQFSSKDIDEIFKLAKEFNTGESIDENKMTICLKKLEALTRNQLDSKTNFLTFCEQVGRVNAKALSFLCNEGLYKDSDGRSPLFLIAAKGTKEDAEYLIHAGAKVNVLDVWKYTPLILACINNNVGVAQALIAAKADVKCRDKDGHATALHFAAQFGYTNLFSLLIENGAPLNVVDKNGSTPLNIAILAGKFRAARILIEQFNANIDYEGATGVTALQDACSKYHRLEKSNIVEAERIYRQIAFMLRVGANINREFHVAGMDKSNKVNYFLVTFLMRMDPNSLHEIDYQLLELFTQYGFDFAGHKITDTLSVLEYILHMKNLRAAKCCQIVPAEAQSVVSAPLSDNKVAFMFHTKKLTPQQNAEMAKLLSFVMDQIVCNAFGELQQIVDEQLDTSQLLTNATPTIKAVAKEPQADNDKIMREIDIISRTIVNLLDEYYDKFAEYGHFNVPSWCKTIQHEKLILKSLNSLESLKNKIEVWGNTTLRHLQSEQHSIELVDENNVLALTLQPPQSLYTPIYEKTLKLAPQLINNVSKYCGLLTPFNDKGDMGIDVITDAKSISADDRLKFQRILADPKISRNPNQPGIRFLTDSNYYCNVIINKQLQRRLIIAELKIADSPHRIALFRLNQEGQGPMVLACAAYIENGFHDSRYAGKIFQAPPIDLTENYINQLIKRITAKDTSTIVLAPPPALSLFKPTENILTTTIIAENNQTSESAQVTLKKQPLYS